ncbi:MAG: galactose-1-phosphate uridylyltransferase [Candidatus Acetothermia bacterium]
MAEVRREITKGTWTIVAPARGDRPFDFSSPEGSEKRKKYVETCPFCPGNESETPEEVDAIRSDEDEPSSWQVRVFPNKFPALDPEGSPAVIEGDLFKSRGGYGFHEVLVETPRHDRKLAELSPREIELVIRTYLNRLKVLRSKPDISYVSLFKNQGKRAGASLEHSHSQIMATTFTPSLLLREYELASEYHKRKGSCLYCDVIDGEKKKRERVVFENELFIVICPYGSRFPYETRIIPKRHSRDFGGITDAEVSELGTTIKKALSGLFGVLGDFPYNYVIHTANPEIMENRLGSGESFHWHLEITPRLTTQAGFERGTEDYINIVSPEKAAARLREELKEG